MIPWRMLLGPGLLLLLKLAGIQYDDPLNLLVIRTMYAISQAFLFVLCAYIYYAISQRGDEKKSIKIMVPGPAGEAGGGREESTLTFKEYDMSELVKLAKNFALGAAITIGIHYYMAVVPALVLQIVTQPISLIDHPLFSIYVLGQDASSSAKLKRPFVDKSPASRLEAMKKTSLKQQ